MSSLTSSLLTTLDNARLDITEINVQNQHVMCGGGDEGIRTLETVSRLLP